jgi:2-amino-4-hydroxy-6-hydroxymethyldihydropteridine diphosphokinase/dihydroneopterin aldolase/2-amino-4-hydroxy-6-hydroxymethyldihydropteridine diphosphokinase
VNARGAHVVLALGSNLGDRAATLAAAVAAITDLPGLTNIACSPVYESVAVKLSGVDKNAPQYLNAVLTCDYTKTPYDLLDAVNAVEAEHGRVRAERWGDRTLDIDLVIFGDLSLDDDRLHLPHPRAASRDFVLTPWLDLDPEALLTGYGPVHVLLAAIGTTVQQVDDGSAPMPKGGLRP